MRPSSEAMRRINLEECRRRIIRMAQCNFTRRAVFVTLTYAQDPEEEQAQRELGKYLRRCKYAAGGRFRYIAVTEVGKNGRIHHHILAEGVSRETLEMKWRGGYANSRVFQENKGGFQGLVRYMLKKNSTMGDEDEGVWKRRIRTSQGMVMPTVKVRDRKISIRRLGIIAEEAQAGGQETLERVYYGWRCQERPRVRTSCYLPGAYMYAVMWRT